MNIAESSRYLSQVNIASTKARLLQHSEAPKLEIARQKGGLKIEHHPIQLDIDNRAFFDSIGLKSITTLATDLIGRGQKAVFEGMAEYADEADMLSAPDGDRAIQEIAVMHSRKSIETMLAFIPEDSPQMNWSGGTVDIHYTPDKMQFHWTISGIERTYIPYQIDFNIEE